MTNDPTTEQVRAVVEPLFEYDKRLRQVEIDMATAKDLPMRMDRMEDKLLAAIHELKPKSPWPALSAITGAIGFLFVIAAAIYTR